MRRVFGEELLLVKPGFTQVSGQVLVLLQAGVAVRRQHLRVSIDENIRALHLLEQLIKGVQIVARDQDSVALHRASPYLCGLGLPEGLDMGLLEQLHGADVHLPRLHSQIQKLRRVEVDIGERGEESPLDEGIHLGIGVAQLPGVVEVGADALDGEEQVILQPGNGRFLSADSFQGAAGAPGGLGALVAEHIGFLNGSHFLYLLVIFPCNQVIRI